MNYWDEVVELSDMDIELPCGCTVAVNHRRWDADLSESCGVHSFPEMIALAKT